VQSSKKSVKRRWIMLLIDVLLVSALVAIWYFMTLLGEAKKLDEAVPPPPAQTKKVP